MQYIFEMAPMFGMARTTYHSPDPMPSIHVRSAYDAHEGTRVWIHELQASRHIQHLQQEGSQPTQKLAKPCFLVGEPPDHRADQERVDHLMPSLRRSHSLVDALARSRSSSLDFGGQLFLEASFGALQAVMPLQSLHDMDC